MFKTGNMGKLRLGMVGGGRGAFIGEVHRMAAALDGQYELVCGAFSSDPFKSKLSGRDLYLDETRIYGTYEEMIRSESILPSDQRMEVVSIVTPNHVHFAPAKMALEYGFHVICDKPLTYNLEEAKELVKVVEETGRIFGLTHNYTGYPMVKQAKAMIKNKDLGEIRKIIALYPQGWLSEDIESSGQKQASWRTDPAKSGIAGALGDIGTHAHNLIEYVSGLEMTELCADVHTHIEGRRLDDDVNILFGMENGARGLMTASQIAAGEENGLTIRIYGTKGSVEWHQMHPNTLKVKWLNDHMQYFRTGVSTLYPEVMDAIRIPAGHPEGYLEAFANIYKSIALAIKQHDKEIEDKVLDFPDVYDGLRGMEFIYKVIESGKSDKKWTQW